MTLNSHFLPDSQQAQSLCYDLFAAAAKSLQSCDPIDGSPWESHPWDSPGKNTGVGCHFLLQCMKVKSQSEVAQSCPTPSNPMDCSPPGSSVHGIFQAKVLEWGAIAFSNQLPQTYGNIPLMVAHICGSDCPQRECSLIKINHFWLSQKEQNLGSMLAFTCLILFKVVKGLLYESSLRDCISPVSNAFIIDNDMSLMFHQKFWSRNQCKYRFLMSECIQFRILMRQY